MRFTHVISAALIASLVACGGGSGGSTPAVGSQSSSNSGGSSSSSNGSSNTASFSFSPASTQASPLTIVPGTPTVVTVNPPVSIDGNFSLAVNNSSCVSASTTLSGSNVTQFSIGALAGATAGCTGWVTITSNGQAVQAFFVLQ